MSTGFWMAFFLGAGATLLAQLALGVLFVVLHRIGRRRPVC